MKKSTKNTVVVGVVGLGLLALAGKRRAPATRGKPAVSLPEQKNATRLLRDRAYTAQLQLSGLQAAFATSSAVAGKFLELGFRDVVARDLGDGAWRVSGRWAKDDADMPRLPSAVRSVVELQPA